MNFIDVTSNVDGGEVRCIGPMSVALSFKLLLLFLQWWKWAKRGALTVKVASMVSYGFTSNFGRGRIL